MYRPPNWDKENSPRICNLRKVTMKLGCPNIPLYWLNMLIEAGADAMLEGLKKDGKRTNGLAPTLSINVLPEQKGWLVFIPEEK